MNKLRFPIARMALMAAALALAVVFVGRGADSPAEAVTFNPELDISVSDPTPGANADIIIKFSIPSPDSFVMDDPPSMQFLPKTWGIHTDAPVGAIAGTFNAYATIAIIGNQCNYYVNPRFTMYESTVDTGYDPATGTYDPAKLTSAVDLGKGMGPGGSDLNPMGKGYTGQFVDDPKTESRPGDFGRALIPFNDNEKISKPYWMPDAPFNPENDVHKVYRDVDNDGFVTPGDIRLWTLYRYYPFIPGTVVQPGDPDIKDKWTGKPTALFPFLSDEFHTDDMEANGQYDGTKDAQEMIYRDVDLTDADPDEPGYQPMVSYTLDPDTGEIVTADIRLLKWGIEKMNTPVKPFFLAGGITRYPDFLNKMLDPAVIGEPLARTFGQENVEGTPVSMNIVTYRPGQLPGYDADLGYPNLVVLMDPADPYDIVMMALTNELCTTLALTSTNFGISQDNPQTTADEGGVVRLTNPKAEKGHDFTLITMSQPDADGDGVENMLDTCPFDPNVEEWGRTFDGDLDRGIPYATYGGDGLDGACDPYPLNADWFGPEGSPDQDRDRYTNRGDNCPLVANGIELLEVETFYLREMAVMVGITGDLIGPDMQADSDNDDIGDACEGSEHGGQCANDLDDDGDGYVNDGCPRMGDTYGEEGDQCLNNTDDDGDGKVNDGCPAYPDPWKQWQGEGGLYYGGPRCDNNLDDDGDGKVNDGCLTVLTQGAVESGDQCAPGDAVDDDGDGYVNDGCPAVDPDDYAKTHITGDQITRVLMRTVMIDRHGVKLDDLDGKEKVRSGGSAQYVVAVENKVSADAQDAGVGLRVLGGCGTVNGSPGMASTTLSLPADGTAKASFTVDWSGCPNGEYTVQADACHVGDPAPAGLFGEGACPGSDPHGQFVDKQLTPSGATASSDYYGFFPATNAIDGDPGTSWLAEESDFLANGGIFEVTFDEPVAVNRVKIEDEQWRMWNFAVNDGILEFSNGYTVDIDPEYHPGHPKTEHDVSFPAQEGITWIRIRDTVSVDYIAMSELKVFGPVFEQKTDLEPLDDAPRSLAVTVGSR